MRALNGFNALLLGLNMIPDYAHIPFEEFFHSFKVREPANIEVMIRKAVALVQLQDDEIIALISFAADANGVGYSKDNLKNLKPDEIFEIVVQVCLELSRIEVNLVSEEEKKRLETSRSISEAFFQGTLS
jgi:hypothetical protein